MNLFFTDVIYIFLWLISITTFFKQIWFFSLQLNLMIFLKIDIIDCIIEKEKCFFLLIIVLITNIFSKITHSNLKENKREFSVFFEMFKKVEIAVIHLLQIDNISNIVSSFYNLFATGLSQKLFRIMHKQTWKHSYHWYHSFYSYHSQKTIKMKIK